MERKTRIFRKVSLVSLALCATMYLGSCNKNAEGPMNAPNSSQTLDATSSLSTTNVYTVDLTGLRSDGGYSYQIDYQLSVSGDSNTQPTASTLRLFENGVELSPAHSLHQDIRDSGKGRFSHWGTSLYFSASDNTNPAKNGRKYTYTLDGSTPPTTTTTTSTTTSTTATAQTSITLTGLRSDGGYSYQIGYALPVSGDSNTQPTASTLRLFENGVELGPAHSLHQDIRDLGKGRFSHWGTSLYFSASDNTNPATNGRKYTYTLGGTPTTTTTTTTPPTTTTTTSTTGVNAGLLGYALVNGTTTGGAGGPSVTVTNETDLKNAVSGSSPKIVYISGTITGAGNDLVYVGSNTSIIGKPGATLVGLSLFESSVNNVIIQDLRLKNYVSNAGVMVKYNSTHVWIDHCEFSTDRNNGWSYWGKDISMTRGTDYCTISWCKFHDNNLSVLISGGLDGYSTWLSTGVLTAGTNFADDYGKLHITLHHNFWYNISEREPDMNIGSVHCFNNYHLNNGGYSTGCRGGGNVRSENEYFSGCSKPISTNLAGDPPGYISGSSTNIYSNCGSNDITTALGNWTPSYSYSSALDPAANVPTIVQQGSGPRAIH